jgi:hypothetical protein
LQDLNKDYPYSLHCYDNESIVYNTIQTFSAAKIISSCILSRLGTETVMTGIVLDDETKAQAFLEGLVEEYNIQFQEDNAEIIGNADENTLCTQNLTAKISGSNFSICVQTDSGKLNAYYETNHKFFIISNQRVVGIEGANLWDRIKTFFRGIFARPNLDPTIYNSLTHTTSYDRIYILKDSNVDVMAIEEYKYDEVWMKPLSVLFIKYNGSNDNNNPIPVMQIFANVNRTQFRNENSRINVSKYSVTGNDQVLIIQTENRTGLWRYFTAILRTRDVESKYINTCDGLGSRECTITSGIGQQTRICSQGKWSDWSTCTLVSCNQGYQQVGSTDECQAISSACDPFDNACPSGCTLAKGDFDCPECTRANDCPALNCYVARCEGSPSRCTLTPVDGCPLPGDSTPAVCGFDDGVCPTGCTFATDYDCDECAVATECSSGTCQNPTCTRSSAGAPLRCGVVTIVGCGNTPTCTGSNTRSCTIANGVGTQSATCVNGAWSWGTCTVVSCNDGYGNMRGSCILLPSGPPVVG